MKKLRKTVLFALIISSMLLVACGKENEESNIVEDEVITETESVLENVEAEVSEPERVEEVAEVAEIEEEGTKEISENGESYEYGKTYEGEVAFAALVAYMNDHYTGEISTAWDHEPDNYLKGDYQNPVISFTVPEEPDEAVAAIAYAKLNYCLSWTEIEDLEELKDVKYIFEKHPIEIMQVDGIKDIITTDEMAVANNRIFYSFSPNTEFYQVYTKKY